MVIDIGLPEDSICRTCEHRLSRAFFNAEDPEDENRYIQQACLILEIDLDDQRTEECSSWAPRKKLGVKI